MLPMPLTSVWSSRARLRPVRRRRRAAANAASSNSGSSGSRAMCATGSGTPAGVGVDQREPAERPLVDEAQLGPAVGERQAHPQVHLVRGVRPAAPAAARSCRGGRAPPPRPSLPGTASSGSQRYLPRRCAPASVRPARRAAKSAAPAAWRRTARGWPTATDATVRPAAQRSRPRRTTSTSGSSGSASPYASVGRSDPPVPLAPVPSVPPVPVPSGRRRRCRLRLLGQLGAQPAPRGRRGLLLGLLLAAPAALAVVLAGHPRDGREQLLRGPGRSP